MCREIAVATFPGFQLLDVTGPAAAFEIAERIRSGSYRLHLVAPGGGEIDSSSGLTLQARSLPDGPFDTIIVSGGQVTRSREAMRELLAWLKRVRARRIASVCSGAYLLAEIGLLDGRKATTHWANCEDFARRYPKVKLDGERIYVRDGEIWTSAGITAGIDLALALIEDDLGTGVARRIAQQLVVHQRRPGGQSQFSALSELEGRTGRFLELVTWMREHISDALTVEKLADRAAMSPRNFARVFRVETGLTPAKAVERVRLEIARAAVETSSAHLDSIAERTGFRDPGRMRRAFIRQFGLPPQGLRRLCGR